jgi:hypothetical protein
MFVGSTKRMTMSKAKRKLTATLPVFATLLLCVPQPALADDIIQVAHDSARMAGNARFCKADEELVDEYIGRAEGKIAAMAKDDYEKVLASVEFKNIMTAMSAKAPEGGCEAFLPLFEQTVKSER